VENAAQLSDRKNAGRWDNSVIAGHGGAGTAAAPGITRLLEEIRAARGLTGRAGAS
jgi:hypothetical protein